MTAFEPNCELTKGPRRAGVLLHPTSLPGSQSCGDLGQEARRFVDFIAKSGFTVWQTLPLVPTHSDLSPYQSASVHAGNTRLISLGQLAEAGWIDAERLRNEHPISDASAQTLLVHARSRFMESAGANDHDDYRRFKEVASHWLEDYALFVVLRERYQNRPWWDWEAPVRDRHPDALKGVQSQFSEALEQVRFSQYLFQRQWKALKEYANRSGVLIFGDLPIFVAQDSTDVWAWRECFRLDSDGRPEVVAGVPPDYFSATGQRWGNPHYDWEHLRGTRFTWWLDRLATELERSDLVRIDHFRGLEACWEIPANAPDAVTGQWGPVPGRELLQGVVERFGGLPLVAEDLGLITPAVDALRRDFDIPGMKVMQFAFDGSPDNPYLPHNIEQGSVCYTGTHDNDTLLGWWEGLDEQTRRYVSEYLGADEAALPQGLIRSAYASVAKLIVLPMQDILNLGTGNRMNVPGTAEGNWLWRFGWDQLSPDAERKFARLAQLYDRTPDI